MVEAALYWMPIIEAEENLRWVNVGAVAGGNLKKAAAQRMVRRWERTARRGHRQAKRPEPVKQDKATFVAGLASLGIEYVEVAAA